MKQPRVSVVMPVYNVEAYLEQCIDSLLQQTMQDFELICVDDGSTDRSPELLRGYAERDSRITVLQQSNGGGGAARNYGMTRAQGEYIIFLDSDDFFEPRLLELTCRAADEHQADVVIFAGYRFDDRTKTSQDSVAFLRGELLPKQPVFSRKDLPDSLLQLVDPAPWLRLYRRAYVEGTGLRYQELPNSNDYYFSLCALALAERVCAVREPLVYYRINNAASTQGRKQKNALCVFQAIEAVRRELRERGIYDELEKSFVQAVLSTTVFSVRSVKTDEARFQVLAYLESDAFREMGLLEHEELWYPRPICWEYVCTLRSALAQYRRTLLAQQPTAERLLLPARAQGPALVSVVIPVYNTTDYLEQTVRTIMEQTLREIEIICVDDGSTDDSLYILLRLADEDERISVYHQENRGLSVTRNVGMAHARGEYLYFMDSDDLLAPDALELLYNRAQAGQLDLLLFDGEPFSESEDFQDKLSRFSAISARKHSYDGVYSGPALFSDLFRNGEYWVSAYLQFNRTSFLRRNHIRFQPGILHEDNLFAFETLLRAGRAGHLPRTLFRRRVRGNSIVTKDVHFANAYGYFASYVAMNRVLEELRDGMEPETVSFASERVLQTLRNARSAYLRMPREEQGSMYGLWEEFGLFELLSRDWFSTMELERVRQRLRQSWAEKSEVNAKLQRTYREKADRGAEIRELKAKLARLEQDNQKLQTQNRKTAKQLKRLKGSVSYRLGRILSWPLRRLRRLFKKA